MKKLLIYIIGVLTLMSSCTIVTSDNGDLEGLWQLTSKENLQTGTVTDMREKSVSWAFQGSLVQMNSLVVEEVTGQFTHTDDYLKVWNLNQFNHQDGDTKIENVEVLYQFGVYQLEPTFKVLELNKKTLQLQCDSIRLNFRKY